MSPRSIRGGHRLAECSSRELQTCTNGFQTLRSSPPLDATLRRNGIDRIHRQLRDLAILLEKRALSVKLAATAFGKLNDALEVF